MILSFLNFKWQPVFFQPSCHFVRPRSCIRRSEDLLPSDSPTTAKHLINVHTPCLPAPAESVTNWLLLAPRHHLLKQCL